MQTSISIDINEKEIKDQATTLARKMAMDIMRQKINIHFHGMHQWDQTKGIGYEMIEKMTEDYLLSEDFEKKIKGMIAAGMDEAMQKATAVALEHHCKKAAFNNLKQINEKKE